MENVKKILFLLLAVLLMTMIVNPSLVNAATTSVTDETTLVEAIKNANNGDVISLTENIVLTKPIEITNKNIAINGNGHTISAVDTNWTPAGENSTLITAGAGATLNLINLTLTNSLKYGIQAYNGGYVILDNVTITNCKYGGVLINAGTVEVKGLNLGHNGREDSNNGIEIAKSATLSGSENNPTLKMNGTLSSTETDQVIYVDINDPIGEFQIVNEDNSENKVYLNDNKLVVTDPENNILYESNEVEGVDIEGEDFVENVTVNVILMEQTVAIKVRPGDTITKEYLMSKIDLSTLCLSNYTLDNFYLEPEFTTLFDFANPITQDTTLYAKLNEIEVAVPEEPKDETPKTGANNLLEISVLTIAISVLAIALLRRKDF